MIHILHEAIWGSGMLALFLGVGLLYSLRLGLFPLLKFPRWWRATAGRLLQKKETGVDGGITQFQSACTALAATIGTGNIAGVATALLAGGPGAIFWMWVSAFIGMATAYGETELGIRYREKGADGSWMAGPMLYLEKGVKSRAAAMLYAFLCMTASFGMGSMVQANAISETLEFNFSLPPLIAAAVLTVVCGFIIGGGAKRIAGTAERLVPVSAAIYMAACVFVIVLFREKLPAAFGQIFSEAFSFRQAAAGVSGYGVLQCVRYGVARGVFSNEAGLGSMAVLNGSAEQAPPGVQGQWAIFEVFFDTIVSCTMTALVILCTMGNGLADFLGNGAALTGSCFSMGLGNLGGYTVSMCVALFAFATIIAWYYMGKQAASYLGSKLGRNLAGVYFFGYLGAVFLGGMGPMEAVWEVSDIFNGLMAVPNLLALVILVREVRAPGSGE